MILIYVVMMYLSSSPFLNTIQTTGEIKKTVDKKLNTVPVAQNLIQLTKLTSQRSNSHDGESVSFRRKPSTHFIGIQSGNIVEDILVEGKSDGCYNSSSFRNSPSPPPHSTSPSSPSYKSSKRPSLRKSMTYSDQPIITLPRHQFKVSSVAQSNGKIAFQHNKNNSTSAITEASEYDLTSKKFAENSSANIMQSAENEDKTPAENIQQVLKRQSYFTRHIHFLFLCLFICSFSEDKLLRQPNDNFNLIMVCYF
jgi:hypothetical protein